MRKQIIDDNKNEGKLLVILVAMWMQWCNAGCIAQWSTSQASLEATGCQHWMSTCATLPRQPPWLTSLLQNTKHYQKTMFSWLTYGRPQIQKSSTFGTRNGPSTQLINAMSCEKMQDALIKAEKLADISSYQTLSANRNLKSN